MGTTPLLISVTTPITDTQMTVSALRGSEGISVPFDYEVDLLSTVGTADFTTVLGASIAITFNLPDGSGIQYLQPITMYRARIRPAFWLLSLQSAYVIYQAKTIPQIIEAVFSALSFTAYKNSLTKTYTALDYVVQYGETSMDFVCRLMEQAGIFYFFQHTASADTLVLADDASAFVAVPGTSTLPYTISGDDSLIGVNGALQQRLVPASYQTFDYNFTTPATSLTASTNGAATKQIAEYPGGYLTSSDGATTAALRLTALEAEATTFQGTCRSPNLHAGFTFTLSGHPRSTANASWVVLRMQIAFEKGIYTNHFTAFPSSTEFRPPRITPRNRIPGTQTALVTGKAGEEIWTDSYGRIKVKFPWDSNTATDDTTSCWVRVGQAWAGKAWGTLFTPRVGQEVIVSFLNGDPEQPLIVGTVYNAVQTMPYTLPADQTKTTLKTISSKGGSGNNELRFEDKAGSEEVFLQAQKDLNVSVVKGNYSMNVAAGTETKTINKTRSITITGAETHTNSDDFTHSISGKSTGSVTGNEKLTNSADFERDVSGNYTLKVTGNLVIKATGSVDIESGTGFTVKAGTSLDQSSGTGFTAKAGTSMAISAGLDASVKASTQLDLEGSATATLKGGGQTAVKGAIVQIN